MQQTQRTLVGVAEHRARVAALIPPTPVERRPVGDCLGLALATDLESPIALPPFDNSAMDGYAVRSVDVATAAPEAPVSLPVAEDIPAGRGDVPPLLPGTAHRIMTGAPVPSGADAVVPVESTDGGVSEVLVRAAARPGAHIRWAGEDVRTGEVVLPAGIGLGPAQLGLAAAVGADRLAVRRPLRVLVLSTGSELVEPGQPLRGGQIYESNGVMLASAVRAAGGTAELLRFVPDDVDAFHRALAPWLDRVDLVLTSGGVSAGAYEVVKEALSGRGVSFHKVAVQPGGPQGLGRYDGGVPVVTLPGNPVSSLVSFEVFVRPALRAAMGFAETERPRRRATLVESLRSVSGKRQYRRGRFDEAAEDTVTVAPVGGPGSHLLSALARANCLLEVPENTTDLPAGSEVTVWLLG
ncbi:molybdopterin molybdenumtransferase [Longimycelium tulufanense]|uniref:Molybdopterin molybdenumtransferase n=1 Tax=Longimycelium tulufanense TaxID=907463 RepID=A0A8J3CDF2_9PSEU|nr:gephyrin-like molybdotransferase Glp [Longimycelium tulufanense]GGM43765.1 molybdopterin molybdenumtransferase [Longimycelium tulufanense]